MYESVPSWNTINTSSCWRHHPHHSHVTHRVSVLTRQVAHLLPVACGLQYLKGDALLPLLQVAWLGQLNQSMCVAQQLLCGVITIGPRQQHCHLELDWPPVFGL